MVPPTMGRDAEAGGKSSKGKGKGGSAFLVPNVVEIAQLMVETSAGVINRASVV